MPFGGGGRRTAFLLRGVVCHGNTVTLHGDIETLFLFEVLCFVLIRTFAKSRTWKENKSFAFKKVNHCSGNSFNHHLQVHIPNRGLAAPVTHKHTFCSVA